MIKKEDILAATNGGLDIILSYYPEAEKCVHHRGKHFKLRSSEKTASCTLTEFQGVWIVKDFGDGFSANAIDLVMKEEMLTFVEAINFLAARYNLVADEDKVIVKKAEFEKRKAKADEPEGSYTTKVNQNFTLYDLKIWFADQVIAHYWKDNEPMNGLEVLVNTLKKYNWYKVEEYTQIKNLEAYTWKSTENFPIYLRKEDEYEKIYKPLEFDKKYRFMSLGKYTSTHLAGYSQALKAQMELSSSILNEAGTADEYDEPKKRNKTTERDDKLQFLIYGAGERDCMNAAALGYHVVWPNSESAQFSSSVLYRLRQIAKNICLIPNLDETGIRTMRNICMNPDDNGFLDIKVVMLPQELMSYKDNRSRPCKDLRDYLRYWKPKHFHALVENANQFRFWDMIPQYDKSGELTGFKYEINNENLYFFLSQNGFRKIPHPSSDVDKILVKITDNAVEEVNGSIIREYLKNFLRKRNFPIKLINVFHRSPQISNNSLENLDDIELNFQAYKSDRQYWFFKNVIWEITASGINTIKPGSLNVHVWKNKVIPHAPHMPKQLPIKIFKDDNTGLWDCEILDTKPLFFRFLWNTCRVFWRVEEEGVIGIREKADGTTEQYKRTTLTKEEEWVQKQHLLNKMYAIGYLLHRHKKESQAYWVYAMENEVQKDNESMGGTGKSLFFQAFSHFCNIVYINARDSQLTSNKHWAERITKFTDIVLFNECSEYFNLHYFFSNVTESTEINPKNKSSFSLSFKESPKWASASNYPPRNLDGSLIRRLLQIMFSDYYHSPANIGETGRKVSDDIGCMMYTDFKTADWNDFFGFMAECLRFYLATDIHPYSAPSSNIIIKNYKSIMGPQFEEWADVMFSTQGNMLNCFVPKNMLFKDFVDSSGMKSWSSQKFGKALDAWCSLNKYTINPPDTITDPKTNRIIKSFQGRSIEMVYIQTTNEKGEPYPIDIAIRVPGYSNKELQHSGAATDNVKDDLPF